MRNLLAPWLWSVLCVSSCTACDSTDERNVPASARAHASTSPSADSTMRSPFDPTGKSEMATEKARPVSKNEVAQGEDYSLEVQNLELCNVDPPFAPEKGNIKQGLFVKVTGTGAREVPVNPLYAKLLDDAGTEYRPTLAGCTPPLPSGRVKNHEVLSGFITFELPEASRGLVLSYSAFVVGRASQTLEVAIGAPSR